MAAEHGLIGAGLKPSARAKAQATAFWRGALDLVFPPRSLDGGPAAQAGGLSAETWSRIHFLDGPVCDGCRAPFEYDQGPDLNGDRARCAACVAPAR